MISSELFVKKTADAQVIFRELQDEAYRLTRAVENLPQTEGDLKEMIDELAAAELGCKQHFVDYPATDGKVNESEASRADWSLRHSRRELAVSRLTKYALAQYKGR